MCMFAYQVIFCLDLKSFSEETKCYRRIGLECEILELMSRVCPGSLVGSLLIELGRGGDCNAQGPIDFLLAGLHFLEVTKCIVQVFGTTNSVLWMEVNSIVSFIFRCSTVYES